MSAVYNRSLSIFALLLGLVSLVLGPLTAIPGIITGHIARHRVENFPHQYAGGTAALLGLLFSYLSLAIAIIGLVLAYQLYQNGELLPLLNQIDQSGALADSIGAILGKPE